MKKKNILFVTGHPAQIHNFRFVKNELENIGHSVFWLAVDKDISCTLLEAFRIRYVLLKKNGKGLASKIKTLLKNNWTSYKLLKANNIDLVISRISPFVILASYLQGIPHIGLSDTESSGKYDTIFSKFLDAYLTSTSYKRELRKDQIRFHGNIELFYLHPNRYKPSDEVLHFLGLEKKEPYVIMRFVSWDAHHDVGLSGFSDENKIRAVTEFRKYAKVFISSEGDLPKELEDYRIKISPEKMHDALANARLFFGESATMASESAVLGTPAIYLNEHFLGYTDEEEKFNLLYSFKENSREQDSAIKKGIELLQTECLSQIISENHNKFMADKIDMTAFFAWFIENWPKSKQIMLENPGYQNRFR